ncbi:MAG TPA: transporter [Planctomycetaceae bacterium]|nr:transporter [Planctomycetaceae bacterium]
MLEPTADSFSLRFSSFIVKNAKWVLLFWIFVAIAVRGTAPPWSELALDGDFEYLPADKQSVAAENLLNKAFPTDRPRSQIVVVIGRDQGRFDRADELAALDLLRRLHHRLAEVLLQRAEASAGPFDPGQGGSRRDVLLSRANESLDEAIRIDEAYFLSLQKAENKGSIPNEAIRLTIAYWDRAQLLQRLGRDDESAFDMQSALILDPDIAKNVIPIEKRSLHPWSTFLDLLSWNDLVLGSRLLNSRARLIVLQSDAELAATHNIDFLAAIHDQVATTQAAHQGMLQPGLEMLATGSAAIGGETLTAARDAIRYTEWFTVLIILAILILVYRSPLLIAIPLVSIGLAVAVSTGVIAWLTIGSQAGWLPGLNMRVFTTSRIFLFVILFGAGTDYCLFLIARVREEVTRSTWEAAIARGLSGVSSALLGSAFTTVVGLGMLWIAEFGKYHHTGPMIAICLLIGLAVCMTLTPAILYLIGPKVFWPQSYSSANATVADTPRDHTDSLVEDTGDATLQQNYLPIGQRPGDSPAGVWGMIALRLTTRPGLALVVGIGLLMFPAAYGWIHEDNVTYDISSQLAASSESRRGFRKLDEHFGIGEVNPTTVLLVHKEKRSGEDLGHQARELSREVYSLDGVSGVRSADDPLGDFPPDRAMSLLSKDAWKRRALKTHRISQGYFFSTTPEFEGRLVRLDVVMDGNPFDIRTANRVIDLGQWLREKTNDASSPWADAEVFLAGTTPSIIDLRVVTLSDHRRIKMAVVISVFLVLLVVIRRVVLCSYLIATVLLSYYATLGMTIIFFRWLYGADYLGLDWKLPLFLFVILVAIGQDYNVYLVTRILEEQKYRPGWLSALRRAVSKTGGIITACGLVMAGTFFSMTASAWFPAMKQWFGGDVDATVSTLRGTVELGFALGLGVLVDTFYVRTILVPSFVAMFDRFKVGRSKAIVKPSALANDRD